MRACARVRMILTDEWKSDKCPRLFTGSRNSRRYRPVARACCAAACPARAGSIRRTIISRCASSATSTMWSRTRSPPCWARCGAAAFELRLDGLSSFGGRKPRAVVASVAPAQPVVELQAEHERLMQRVGLEPEGRKYTPHVTLARLRDSSSRQVADYLSMRGGVPLDDVHGRRASCCFRRARRSAAVLTWSRRLIRWRRRLCRPASRIFVIELCSSTRSMFR